MQASTAEFDKTKLSDLKSYTTLGVGTFSRVALIEHRRTGKTYALKRMEKKTIVNRYLAGSVAEVYRLGLIDQLPRDFLVDA